MSWTHLTLLTASSFDMGSRASDGVSSPFKMQSEGLPSSSCGVCNRLWDDTQDLVMQNLHCPFVVINTHCSRDIATRVLSAAELKRWPRQAAAVPDYWAFVAEL